jgi:hypothetical protein
MYAIPPAQKRGLALQKCGHIAHLLYVGSRIGSQKHLAGAKVQKIFDINKKTENNLSIFSIFKRKHIKCEPQPLSLWLD